MATGESQPWDFPFASGELERKWNYCPTQYIIVLCLPSIRNHSAYAVGTSQHHIQEYNAMLLDISVTAKNLWQGLLLKVAIRDGFMFSYLFDRLWPNPIFSPAGTMRVMHISQSDESEWPPLALTLTSARWALCVCRSLGVRAGAVPSGRLNPDTTAPGAAGCRCPDWCVHHHLHLPAGNLMCSTCRNKPRCDPRLQTEAAVMNEACGPRPQ